MSEALLLTGKRGQGKTLYAMEKVRRYLSAGRMVATNVNIFVEHLVNPSNRVRTYRLPDWPTVEDLKAMPLGNPNPREEKKNGLLLLDEAATFLNSRSWDQDKKGRVAFIGWLAQSRKFGWDLCLLAQHADMIDSQIRQSLFEHFGICVNLEGMMIPFLTKFSQGAIRLPRLHRVSIRLGSHPRAPLVEHAFYKGEDLFKAYDTLQVINPDVGVSSGGGYYLLSAWDIRGRYLTWWQRMRKLIFGCVAFGAVFGYAAAEARHALTPKAVPAVQTAKQDAAAFDPSLTAFGSYRVGGVTHVLLSDGRDVVATATREFSTGERHFELSPGQWVKGR